MASFQQTSLEVLDVKTPRAKDAPLVIDDWTLAFRLGFSGKFLWHVVRNHNHFGPVVKNGAKVKGVRLYDMYRIPKASGGRRTIHAPNKLMDLFLKQLRVKVLLPLTQHLGPHVGAYQPGKAPKDSAVYHLQPCPTCAPADQPHTCKEVVFDTWGVKDYKIVRSGTEKCVACRPVPKHDCPRKGVKVHFDLKDFFGSTRRSWVRKYFHEVVGYNHYVSSLLADLMTVKFETKGGKPRFGVPQGAPTSGDICNLVADRLLDQPLLKALEGTGWVYSRYADDLYLSHPQNLSRDAVDQMIAQVNTVIEAAGYKMNRKKLHIQRPHRRQQLLGVVLNQKVNIPRDRFRRMEAIIHNSFHRGFEAERVKSNIAKKKDTEGKFITWIKGNLSYMSMVNPHRTARLSQLFELALVKHGHKQPKQEMLEAA